MVNRWCVLTGGIAAPRVEPIARWPCAQPGLPRHVAIYGVPNASPTLCGGYSLGVCRGALATVGLADLRRIGYNFITQGSISFLPPWK